MAPKRYHPAKAGSTSTSSKTPEKEHLAESRALKRAERVKARHAEAEKRKEVGNAHFRKGKYRNAIEEYEAAIKINGPTSVYLSNMAAAWLKLEAYDIAEHCAQRALVLDPTFMKARYRRGLARKGSLQFYAAILGALTRAASHVTTPSRATETEGWYTHEDFEVLLKQDPNSTEAKKALDETLTLMNERDDDDDESDAFDQAFPSLDETKVELESVSDSSDWNHGGNGIPCRFYNHDGCMRGTGCRYSHAPDHRNVRDRLGRNVCMHFLLEDCKFGSSACVYSHDKSYLPSGRWWDDDDKVVLLRQMTKGPRPKENSAFMPYMCGLSNNRLAWAAAHGVEMEEVYGHWRDQAKEGFCNAADEGLYAALKGNSRGYRAGRGRGRGRGRDRGRGSWHSGLDLDDFEESERRNSFGFTEGEMQELLCQGVMPWDDDACDVLDAIYSL